MVIKRSTDAELIEKMFPASGQSDREIEAAWHEFMARFELILVKTIRIACHQSASQFQLTDIEICHLVERVFQKISVDDYQAMRELRLDKENSLDLYLSAVATNIVLDRLRTAQVVKPIFL
jgi:hypothetical protein